MTQRIVIDTNAFIRGSLLMQLGTHSSLVTTAAVMNQIRDEKTRQLINSFPFEIKILEPPKESVKFVENFANKTGDIANLSEVDIQVIALGYYLCVKDGYAQLLNKEPKQIQEPTEAQQRSSSEQYSDEDSEEQPKQSITIVKESKQQDEGWIVVQPKRQKPKQQSESSDEDAWITPLNYSEKKLNQQIEVVQVEANQKDTIPISIMTSDFAMQNVILQIGIPMKSVDGLEITAVKRFVLQCYLCWKLYRDVAANKIKLCDKCGYNSLSKVSYSLDCNGNMILHRKKRWTPNKQVQEWKERKLHEQAERKKNRRKKQKKISIFQ